RACGRARTTPAHRRSGGVLFLSFFLQGRSEASPRDFACEAKLLEIGAVVLLDARRQHVALPRSRRKLEAAELRDDASHAFASMRPRAVVHVLPAQQETHEIGRG